MGKNKNLKSMSVPVLFDGQHNLHAPLFEFDKGLHLSYQEVPHRAETVLEALKCLDWVNLLAPLAENKMDLEELFTVHDPALIVYLQESSRQVGLQDLEHPEQAPVYQYPWLFPVRRAMMAGLLRSEEQSGCFAFDTYSPIGKNTWPSVLCSARLAWQGAGLILAGEKLVYSINRPPGHHAGPDYIGGYCYLNNAALAASRLIELGPGAVLDIDYHHGNGTQDIFWNNPNVLTISIHADPAEEYPYFSGFADETGGEDAKGANINIPVGKGCKDDDYLDALDQAIRAIMNFTPRLTWLVLSVGYDTSIEDPTSFFELTDSAYEEIGRRIGSLAFPTLVVQEGGYAVNKIGELAVRLLQGLNTRVND